MSGVQWEPGGKAASTVSLGAWDGSTQWKWFGVLDLAESPEGGRSWRSFMENEQRNHGDRRVSKFGVQWWGRGFAVERKRKTGNKARQVSQW